MFSAENFHMQIVLLYLQMLWHNSLLKYASV